MTEPTDLTGDRWNVLHGNSLNRLKELPDNSVDSIVTDPPYGLSNDQDITPILTAWLLGDDAHLPTGKGFMGKEWDSYVPPPAIWKECLRVLKPGGHLLAFFGSRTQDIGGLAIRLAGFEIRDSIAWVYGSGFPKSHDIGKAIDKLNAPGEHPDQMRRFTGWMKTTGLTSRELNEATGTNMGGHYLTTAAQPAVPTPELFALIQPLLVARGVEVPEWVNEYVHQRGVESKNYKSREVTGQQNVATGHAFAGQGSPRTDTNITISHTPEARKWEGWGTALKPAVEPIIVARKPIPAGVTVATNVLTHGTGAINIGASRVGEEVINSARNPSKMFGGSWEKLGNIERTGRFPTNLIVDETTITDLPEQAQAFFYCAKASKADRMEGIPEGEKNFHPTVKPTSLMRYLVKLVTPAGGVVLDPFTGSGSTGKAALLEGFRFIGVELTEDYLPIIQARLDHAASLDEDRLL